MTKKHEPCLVALKFWKKHCPYSRGLSTGAGEASTLAIPVTAEGASPSCTHTGIRHTGQSGRDRVTWAERGLVWVSGRPAQVLFSVIS